MCKTLNLIHHRKATLDLRNEDIAQRMTSYMGESVSKEAVGHYFTGNAGVPLEKIGALLDALGLKVTVKESHEIAPEMLSALKQLAELGLKQV